MTTKRMAITAGIVLVLLLAAYLWGYWPERQRRVAADQQAADFQQRTEAAEAQVRAARLLGDLLHLTDAAAAMNYGVAQDLSSSFFDAARAEAERTPDEGLRTALQDLAARRDAVTSVLAIGDPRVVDTLRQMEVDYREALGYPTGFRAPVAPPADAPAR